MSETFENLETAPLPAEPTADRNESDFAITTIPTSPYELVVIAAQEARRLNERWRRAASDRTTKVTKTAVDRVLAGQVRFVYDQEETPES